MNRRLALNKAFQRGHLLSLKHTFYRAWIEKFIVEEMKGDLGNQGDITTDLLFKKDKKTKAVIIAKEEGIIAGIEEVVLLYKKNGLRVSSPLKDGARARKGTKILEIRGSLKSILRVERSALDVLQRMSGIATITDALISKVKGKVAIAPTRKTQWRYLDKKAVFVGGGLTHRLALWDAILIKENHLDIMREQGEKMPLEKAIKKASESPHGNFIEIEVEKKEQALKAAELFSSIRPKKPCLIMLDNFTPRQIKETIRELKKKNAYHAALFEASGGINPQNISSYADTGVDVISMGYLTHSPTILDLTQLIE